MFVVSYFSVCCLLVRVNKNVSCSMFECVSVRVCMFFLGDVLFICVVFLCCCLRLFDLCSLFVAFCVFVPFSPLCCCFLCFWGRVVLFMCVTFVWFCCFCHLLSCYVFVFVFGGCIDCLP